MAEQQALNATFFAFRKRERGGVLVGASIAYLVVALLIGGGFVALNWQGFLDYINWVTQLGAAGGKSAGVPPSPEMMMPPASVMAIAPWYTLMLIVGYVLFASYEAACLRWMIHGETGGLMGLTLGADTWRVYFTYWVWLLLLIAFYIVGAIVAVATGFSLFAMSQNQSPAASSVLLPIACAVLFFVGLIYFAVRFAPAAATSVARRRFSFFDAWTVTKGRFWAMFGAFLLLFLMFFVFYFIVAGGLGFALASLAIGQVQAGADAQSPEEVMRLFTNPQFFGVILIFAGLMIAASMTLYVAMFGVNARAAVAALEQGKIKPAE